jgi:HPt (histidine-containing phosphotransfer) domain-containing protein
LPIDDPEIREIVTEFVQRCGEHIERLYGTLEKCDYEQLAREAHWLKGSGGTAGFAVLTELARELEAAAKAGQHDACRRWLRTIKGIHARIVIAHDSASDLSLVGLGG